MKSINKAIFLELKTCFISQKVFANTYSLNVYFRFVEDVWVQNNIFADKARNLNVIYIYFV